MPKTEIPGMGKRARVYTGIYRYFTIPVYIPVYTGILPYRYIPSEILRPPYKQATNTLPYRVTYPAGGTAVGLMRRLRQLGVRAHFWI